MLLDMIGEGGTSVSPTAQTHTATPLPIYCDPFRDAISLGSWQYMPFRILCMMWRAMLAMTQWIARFTLCKIVILVLPFYCVSIPLTHPFVVFFIVVSYRGSSSVSNYWTDATTALVPYRFCAGCLVHDGFFLADEHIAVHSGLLPVLSDLQRLYPTYSTVFTGHSLGEYPGLKKDG